MRKDSANHAHLATNLGPAIGGRGPYTARPTWHSMDAGSCFKRLAEASARNVITSIDIFLSATGKPPATTCFQYDRTVRDGTGITFRMMDLFKFEAQGERATHLNLI